MTKQQILIISLSILSISFITSTFVMNYKIDYEREVHHKAYVQFERKSKLYNIEKDENSRKYKDILDELEYVKNTQNNSNNYPQINGSNLYYRTLYALELKAEMTENCAVITTIPAGAKVEVITSFFGRIWEVRYNGNTGWVNANGTLEKI